MACSYADHGPVEGCLQGMGIQPLDTVWSSQVSVVCDVEVECVDALCRALKDLTSGRVELTQEPALG